MIKEVAFVAIAVSDAERARKFYQETLELKPATTAIGGAWVEYELGATTIGKLKERGVAFEMEKMETPVCWMAQFRDPDGNKLVIHKRKVT